MPATLRHNSNFKTQTKQHRAGIGSAVRGTKGQNARREQMCSKMPFKPPKHGVKMHQGGTALLYLQLTQTLNPHSILHQP